MNSYRDRLECGRQTQGRFGNWSFVAKRQGRPPRLLTQIFPVVLVGFGVVGESARAQIQITDGCMQDVSTRYGGPNLNCTANDISITAVTLPLTPPDGCDFLGDTTTFDANVEVQSTATERFDIGVYIALDSGNALNGSCLISTLPRSPTNNNPACIGAGNPFICCTGAGTGTCGYGDLDNPGDTGKYCTSANTQICNDNADCGAAGSVAGCTGVGAPYTCCTGVGTGTNCVFVCTGVGVPFACCTGNQKGSCGTCPGNAANTDLCGDIDGSAGGHNPVYYKITGITVTCLDTNNDGFLDVSACMSWNNSEGAGELCRSPLAAFPNTPSKCNCQEALKIPISVPKTIQVCKDLIPSNDSGLFNLQIDGVTRVPNGTDGSCSTNVAVTAGTHSVGETAGTGTSLSDYNTNIFCVDSAGRCTGNASISCFNNVTCSSQSAGTCNLTPTSVGSCTNCTSFPSISIGSMATKIVCTITNTNVCNNSCGDGSCNCGENCSTCPADCGCTPCTQACIGGVCQSTCGNGTCNPACEDCSTCPGDCGCVPCTQNCVAGTPATCQPACGDGTCNPSCENCSNCPADCGCGPCDTCVSGVCNPNCGNGTCNPSGPCPENCNSCPSDCQTPTCSTCVGGVVTPDCGNGVCQGGPPCFETCSTCPSDCGCPSCETCISGVCTPNCGNGTCEMACGENCSTCPGDCGCTPCTENCVSGVCQPACGDGTCDPNCENCNNCPADCGCDPCIEYCDAAGACQQSCGDGTCDANCENCSTCPSDCGCPSCQTCVLGFCESDCGNGVCQSGAPCFEDCSTCAGDCQCAFCTHECIGGVCEPTCGDGFCDPACENCNNCADCACDPCTEFCDAAGACQPSCGDGTCDPNCENCDNCPGDCPCALCTQNCEGGACVSACGDGTCDPNCENCCNCAADCGCGTCNSCNPTTCMCTPDCGNGFCDPACEDCNSCPTDCGCPACETCIAGPLPTCQPNCGNGLCEPGCGEDCETCPADCTTCPLCTTCIGGVCTPDCGNGVCDPACENCTTCPTDCGCIPCTQNCVKGMCISACPDGTCNPACENCNSCADCVCDPCTEYCDAAGACQPSCGNGTCDPACENCTTCPQDCVCPTCTTVCNLGICEPTCGDGACNPDCEDCTNCPVDCHCQSCAESCEAGLCVSTCGDGICDVNCENCSCSDCVCNDNVDCTNDTCVAGVCVYTPNNAKCDDGIPCTADSCNVGTRSCDHSCATPDITCPPDKVFECDAVGDFGDPTVEDNCSVVPMVVCTEESTPGKLPQERTIIRTCTVTNDCGNTDQCEQRIDIVDTTPPVVTCPPDCTLECGDVQCVPPECDDPSCECGGVATCEDNCSTCTVTVSCEIVPKDCTAGQTAGLTPPPKLTVVRTYTGTDADAGVTATGDGNNGSCVQRIEIVDSTPPLLVDCPGTITICRNAELSFPPPTCTDTCGTCSVTCVRSDGLPFPGPGPSGPITVTCVATDECGNESSCTVDVEVSDSGECFVVIPTVSEWGLVILTLLLLSGAKVYFGRRQVVSI